MNIWGISANSHDAAVSVWHDKQLQFAAHSERYSGIKNDGDLCSGIIEDADKPTNKIVEPVIEETKVEPVAEVVEEPAVEEGFDADATDGDGDGFLQDGTPHQRPVEEK